MDHPLLRYFGGFTIAVSVIIISIIPSSIDVTYITAIIFNIVSRYKNGGEVVEEGSVFTGGRTRTEPSSNVLTVLPRKEVLKDTLMSGFTFITYTFLFSVALFTNYSIVMSAIITFST